MQQKLFERMADGISVEGEGCLVRYEGERAVVNIYIDGDESQAVFKPEVTQHLKAAGVDESNADFRFVFGKQSGALVVEISLLPRRVLTPEEIKKVWEQAAEIRDDI